MTPPTASFETQLAARIADRVAEHLRPLAAIILSHLRDLIDLHLNALIDEEPAEAPQVEEGGAL